MEPLQSVTADHYAVFIGQFMADVIFFKGLGNAYTFLKEIDVLEKMGESAAAVAKTFKQAVDTHLANNPILVTAEGVKIKSINNTSKTSQLENIKTVLPEINQTHIAILKNGYYEVNGFKFTEYYYNRLWNNGREAPSLAAQAILENTIAIIPDPEQIPGFFKYFAEGWEMIYNPTTKVVSHIQQIKKSK